MKQVLILLFGTVITTLLVCPTTLASQLTLELYLEQVGKANSAIQGATQAAQGASERAAEGSLIFSPTLFSNIQLIEDQQPTSVPASQGDKTKILSGEIGLSQATSIGLTGKLSYGITDTTVYNTNPSYVAHPAFTDTALKLQLNQPLWQNRWGRQFLNMERATSAQMRATSWGKRHEIQMTLFDAETKYWKLASIRQTIRIIKKSLEKTKNVLEFNRTKVRRNLADATDLLQAEAQLKSRTLDLQSALDEENEAMRAFNAARNIDGAHVTEEVILPSIPRVQAEMNRVPPQAIPLRNDLKALQEGLNAAQAANEIGQDKMRPDLNLFAQGVLHARSNQRDDTFGKMVDGKHPYLAVGVNISMPLDFWTRNQIQKGYQAELIGAKLAFEQKKFDQGVEWQSLHNKISLLKERISLAEALKKAQLAKLENERIRQRDGHSTTFQVFQFEQENLAAELNLVQLQTTALVLLAQIKTFNDLNK